MTENDFILELSHRMGWTEQETSGMVVSLGKVISSCLVDNCIISLQGLGQFKTRKIKERVLKEKDTDKSYLLPPELIPVFQIDNQKVNFLKESINPINGDQHE